MNLMDKLDDPEFCRGVVLSLRSYLEFAPNSYVPTDHMQDIAAGTDEATKAFIEALESD